MKENFKKLEKITWEEVWSETDGVWERNKCGQVERHQRNDNQIAEKEYIDP